MSKIRCANRVDTSGGRGKQLADLGREQGSDDVLEDVAFGHDHGTASYVKCMTAVSVPFVVDLLVYQLPMYRVLGGDTYSVQKCVAANLGASAACVVDVVALERDQVVRADHVECPVVVTVAGGGPAGASVELGVGDGNAVGSVLSRNEHLPAYEGDFDMIDPY